MISSPLEKLNTDSNVVALSRLGYPIPIFDENGDWLENINIVDDIGEIRVLESRKIETSDWQLNEAIKFCAKRSHLRLYACNGCKLLEGSWPFLP